MVNIADQQLPLRISVRSRICGHIGDARFSTIPWK